MEGSLLDFRKSPSKSIQICEGGTSGHVGYNPSMARIPTKHSLTDFLLPIILYFVNTTTQADTVWFTTKGQVVIPLRLRKLFNIEDGTRHRHRHRRGILLKPVTKHAINRLRGILKRKPGEPPMSGMVGGTQTRGKELEERKYARHRFSIASPCSPFCAGRQATTRSPPCSKKPARATSPST